MKYVHNSLISSYLTECQRLTYYRYLYPDPNTNTPRGLQGPKIYIELFVGSLFHLIEETVLLQPKQCSLDAFADLVARIKQKYFSEANGLDDFKHQTESQLAYSIQENWDLLEAMAYLWFLYIYPTIIDEYEVVTVEREIENHLSGSTYLLSKMDALLLHKASGEYHISSEKTAKSKGIFTDATQDRDFQGHLEINAVNIWLPRMLELTKIAAKALSEVDPVLSNKLVVALNKKWSDSSIVEAIRFNFMIKGEQREDKGYSAPEGYKLRQNPFIYGYRKKSDAVDWEYAHSFVFYNPHNKSGEGRLGKGWEKFRIADDYPGGILAWIKDIETGKIQPEAENPIHKFIALEEPTRRIPELVTEAWVTAQLVVSEIEQKLTISNSNNNIKASTTWGKASEIGYYQQAAFLPNTKRCEFPSPCQFRDICPFSAKYDPYLQKDPFQFYKPRNSHYQIEQKELEKYDH